MPAVVMVVAVVLAQLVEMQVETMVVQAVLELQHIQFGLLQLQLV